MNLSLPDCGTPLTVVSFLGSGASSNVYSCINEPSGQVYAAKVARSTSPSASSILQNEERILRRLLLQPQIPLAPPPCSIPSMVALLPCHSDHHPMTLITQPVGQVLTAELLTEHERLAFTELPQQVVAALRYSHRLGYVHRDVRPANLILTTSPESPLLHFHLIDW